MRQPRPLLALGATDGSLLARARRLLIAAEREGASPRLAASADRHRRGRARDGGHLDGRRNEAGAGRSADDGRSRALGRSAHEPGVELRVAAGSAAGSRPARQRSRSRRARSRRAVRRRDGRGPSGRRAHAAQRGIGSATPSAGERAASPRLLRSRRHDHRRRRMSSPGTSSAIGRTACASPGSRSRLRRRRARQSSSCSSSRRAAVDAAADARCTASTLPLPFDLDDRPGLLDRRGGHGIESRADRRALRRRVDGRSQEGPGRRRRAFTTIRRRSWPGSSGVCRERPDEVRAEAVEWLAWHPIPAALAALERRRVRIVRRACAGGRRGAWRSRDAGSGARADRAREIARRRRRAPRSDRSARRASRDGRARRARRDRARRCECRHAAGGGGDAGRLQGPARRAAAHRARRDAPEPADVRREAVETLGDALPKETAVPLLKQARAGRPRSGRPGGSGRHPGRRRSRGRARDPDGAGAIASTLGSAARGRRGPGAPRAGIRRREERRRGHPRS